MTNRDLMEHWESWAPLATAEDWDNPGLLIGSPDDEIRGIVVSLDATAQALEVARSVGANLLVTHHPVIFAPLKRLDRRDVAYRAAALGIDILSMHTNLDKAAGGVNDTLAERLGLQDVRPTEDGMCRVGRLAEPMTAGAFARAVAAALDTPVRLGTAERTVTAVAVCGGSGGEFLSAMDGVADAFVTGEVRHHEWLAANAAGIVTVEAGHYATEQPVTDAICRFLAEQFPAIPVTAFDEAAPYETVR